MVDFMRQRDWVTACPDIWSNILLSVSAWVFLDEITISITISIWASLVAQMVKNLPAMQETRVRSLGW